MLPISSDSVVAVGDFWIAVCKCKNVSRFKAKNNALQMVARGTCRYCKKDYRSTKDEDVRIYKNANGKWCCTCSGCGIEQAYTRKDHAKQSFLRDWQCKKCVKAAGRFSQNAAIGAFRRIYNKFQKSAFSRGIEWNLDYDEFCSFFTGNCSLTGWPISIEYQNCTASLDRIDSSRGYLSDNVRWVHTMVNMCKNKYDEKKFIEMCVAVARKADKEKW